MADWHPIHTGVRNALLANAALVVLAPASRWFADQLPDRGKTYPALRYVLIGEVPDQRLSSGDNIDVTLQVDGYHNREDAVALKAVMDQVRATLDRVNLTVTGYNNVHSMCVQRPTGFKEDPYFRMISQFRLFGTAT